MREIPTGTVTLLFTDMEGSTRLLQQLGERYSLVLKECRQLLRSAFHTSGGHEVDTQGDAFFVAFARASDAVAAAAAAQRALFIHSWPDEVVVRVRMGLHTGEPQLAAEGYVGLDVHHAARIMSAGHGGQVLLSQTTRDLVEYALPEGMSLLDVGIHRLKDLQQPCHLFQLSIAGLPADFPPLKTLDRFPHNLPIQPTPFIGREKEVNAVIALLRREEVRLLTLTGTGGTGKTRLGLQVAAELSGAFAHGVFFVNLAPLSDPELVIPAISEVLGVKEMAEHSLIELLNAFLREKHLLLLLDNFEQVASAALQVAGLLAVCPKLKILLTSRMALHVRTEQEFAVPPLTLPDPKRLPDLIVLAQNEAVALFIQRAQAVKSDFGMTTANAPAVAEMCVRLDGLPLAIELAAARSKLFPPQALLARLEQRLGVLTGGARDAPARQQTLRNTIEWSYHLLDAGEQRLFRRLCIFVGGCTLEAAESLSIALGDEASQVMNVIASLIDKSMVQESEQEGEEPRLGILETIREFGQEVLTVHQEMEPTRAAHAVYYLRLAEEADEWLWGRNIPAWLERLELEHDNLRAALAWWLEPGHGEEATMRKEMALRMGGALHRFWFSHGYYTEGCTFLIRAITTSEGFVTASRAKALVVAADMAHGQGDMERGEMFAEECLVLSRAVGYSLGIARSLGQLGRFAGNRNEYSRARSLLEESMALCQELGNHWYLAWSLFVLGNLYGWHGEHVKSEAHLEEALALWRDLGDRECAAIALTSLAQLLHNYGDRMKARSMSDEALMLFRELGSKQVVQALDVSAQIALSQGNLAEARQLSEEAVTRYRELGIKGFVAYQLSVLARVEARLGDYDKARQHYEELLPLAREVDDKDLTAIILEGLAEIVIAQGEGTWAAWLLGAAESIRQSSGIHRSPTERMDYEQAVAAAHTHLGEQAFNAAWNQGLTMTFDRLLIAPARIEAATPSATRQLLTTTMKRLSGYPAGLTTREVAVLRLVVQGLTDAQVGKQLVISPRTVNSHLTAIYGKIQVSSRSAAIRYALEHHLI